jgi:hypothetical protein
MRFLFGLYINNNRVNGTLQGLSQLTALRAVALRGNRLSGKLDPLAALTNLTQLFLTFFVAAGFGEVALFFRGPRFTALPARPPAATPTGPAIRPPMTAPATVRTMRRRRRRLIRSAVVSGDGFAFMAKTVTTPRSSAKKRFAWVKQPTGGRFFP